MANANTPSRAGDGVDKRAPLSAPPPPVPQCDTTGEITDAWHESYRRHLSGSKVSRWLGFHSYSGTPTNSAKGRLQMIQEWEAPRPAVSGRPNPRLERGTRCEPKGVEAYIKLTGIDRSLVSKAAFVEHPEYPWLGATPDAFVGSNGLLEVKCPARQEVMDGSGCVYVEEHWLLQIHLQLECTGRDWCDLLVWSENYVWLFRVLRDEPIWHTDWPSVATRVDDTTALLLLPPQTLMQSLLPEYRKYAAFVRSDRGVGAEAALGSDCDKIARINWDVACYRKRAVRQLAVGKTTEQFGWIESSGEDRTNPLTARVVDRFPNPNTKEYGVDKNGVIGSFLRVHWLNALEKEDGSHFYSYKRDGPARPPGGVICCEHRSLRYTDTRQLITTLRAGMPCGAGAWGVAT